MRRVLKCLGLFVVIVVVNVATVAVFLSAIPARGLDPLAD